MKLKKISPWHVRQARQMNQTDFWGRIGVTQSGGSRFETGREMPKPVRILLGAVYLNERLPRGR